MKKILIFFITLIMLMNTTVFADFTHFPPSGLGTMHTYTVWDGISWGGDSRHLINWGRNWGFLSDSYGLVTYGDYFAGATTSTFGQVGDMLLVVETDGLVYPVIIQDHKSQGDSGCTAWGHHGGKDIVEFEVLRSMRGPLYHGSGSYINDLFAHPIYKVINIGSVYENDYYLTRVREAARDYGLQGYSLIVTPYDTEFVWNFEESAPVEEVKISLFELAQLYFEGIKDFTI